MTARDDRPIEQEFAVTVAALLAGRIDGRQAVASLAAQHATRLAAVGVERDRLAAAVERVREVLAGAWDGGYTAGMANGFSAAVGRDETTPESAVDSGSEEK